MLLSPARIALVTAGLALGAITLADASAGAQGSEGACAAPHWVARPLTTLSTIFPRTGAALVVALENDASGALPGAELPALSLVRGRRTTYPLAPLPIAPGLFRVPFAPRATRGIWTLRGLGADTTLTVGVSAMPGVPVRPEVREVRRVAATGLRAGATPRLEVRALLGFPVPEGTVAATVSWDTNAEPSAWGRVVAGQTEIVVFVEGGSCAPGWAGPPEGPTTARIAWVDRFGQVSPASDAVTLQ
jgi:hypothetical protein